MPFTPDLLDQILQHPDMASFVGAGPMSQDGQAPQDPYANAPEYQPPPPAPDAQSGVAPVTPPVPTGPGPQSVSAGASASHTGTNEAALARRRAEQPGVNRDMAAAETKAREGQQGEEDAARKAYDQGVNAANELTTAQSGQAYAQSQGDAAIARLNQHFSITESMAAAHAAAMTAQYRANLEGDLARVRAMKVDSGKLYKDMTGSEKLGTAAALFTQGFLGTRGIQTGAREALQYWVERSVSDQEAAIREGHEMVQSDKMLWDMARSQSHDDQEARDRVQAYMMAQAQAEIKSQVDSYGSALAKANGDAAIAQLGQDLNKHIASIVDRYDSKAQQAAQFVWTRYKDTVHLAHESASLGLQQKLTQAKIDALNAKGQQQPFFIYDQSRKNIDPKTGQAIPYAVLAPAYAGTKEAPKIAQAVNARLAAVSDLHEEMASYKKLVAETGRSLGQGALFGDYLRSTNGDKIRAAQHRLAMAMARAMNGEGKLTDQDQRTAEALIPMATWTGMSPDAVLQVVDQEAGVQIAKVQRDVLPLTVPISGVGPTGGVLGANGPLGDERTAAEAGASPPPPNVTRVDTIAKDMTVPADLDKPATQEASNAVFALAGVASGGTLKSLMDPLGNYRILWMKDKVGKPTEAEQMEAWKALSAYESGTVPGTNIDLRHEVADKMKWVQEDRAKAGLPPLPKLTAKDLAGYDPGHVVNMEGNPWAQSPPITNFPASDQDGDSDHDTLAADLVDGD